MAIATQQHEMATSDLGFSRLSVRAAQIGIAAVLVAALALGLAWQPHRFQCDPADAAIALTLSNQ